jgi:type III pantothenate kinase
MKVTCVVDAGNSRLKWGRCGQNQISESASLPLDDPRAWNQQRDNWKLPRHATWAVSGVQPQRRDAFVTWLRRQGHQVLLLESARQLPLSVPLEKPDAVGIDRLLNAVAVNLRRPAGVPAVVIDAGSAVTVDWVDGSGEFRGGAIFPGLRLMAQALHDHTALLPLVEIPAAPPALPGTSTRAAMAAGIFWAVVGGMEKLIRQIEMVADASPVVFLAGGDGSLLEKSLSRPLTLWPHITLEGIRVAVETLP